MTRKTVTCGKDGEGRDYMKLKGLLECKWVWLRIHNIMDSYNICILVFIESGEYHSDIDHILLDTAATGVVRYSYYVTTPLSILIAARDANC